MGQTLGCWCRMLQPAAETPSRGASGADSWDPVLLGPPSALCIGALHVASVSRTVPQHCCSLGCWMAPGWWLGPLPSLAPVF